MMSSILSSLMVAAGAVFTWQGADNASWQDESSYAESGKPTSGDTVVIPNGKHPVVTDADFAYVSSLALVELKVHCSVAFDVTGENVLGCAVRQEESQISSYERDVALIKDGPGVLTLAAPITPVNPYRAEIDVVSGSLRFADDYQGQTISAVLLNVSEGAVFDLNGIAQYNIGQLFGDGVITNGFEHGSSLVYIQRENKSSEFGGKILGNVALRATSNGATMNLTGTENDFHTFYSHSAGTVGISKFGNAGESSSIGTNEWMEAKANGARFVYLGEDGEETDKKLKFDNSSEPMTMDGGAHGGVTFNGAWGLTGSSTKYMRRLVLDGSNMVNACVFAGPYDDYGTSGYATYITKKGPGIWRFADNADRKNHGVIAVEDGTLRFDSIAEAGEVCSLGLATALYSDYYGKDILPENAVPYALLLGGDTTEGVLEYTGSTEASCTSRLVAVKGPARLRNATDNDFYLKGVTGWGEGTRVLTLDGDSTTADNRLESVVSDTGALSIAKDGAGTWTLAGDQKLNGGTIAVKGGTLVVERKAVVPTWYRFTVKQCMMYSLVNRGHLAPNDRSKSNDKNLFLNELAFYDENGVRCNAGIAVAADGTAVKDLQAGEVIQTKSTTYTGRPMSRLFDGVGTGDGWNAKNSNTTEYMSPSTPDLWMQIVFRPKEKDLGKVIAAYDFANTYCETSNLKYQRWFQPDIFTIEGSADGENWVVLTNVLSSAENKTGGHWNSDDTEVSNADRPGKGFPIDGRLHDAEAFDGVSAVSVAKDATLKSAVGDGRLVIRGLTLDPADGAGTIDGFDIAESGVLNLTDLPTGGTTFKYTLKDVNDFGNVADWELRLKGEPTSRYSVSVKSTGEITVLRPGLLLYVK